MGALNLWDFCICLLIPKIARWQLLTGTALHTAQREAELHEH